MNRVRTSALLTVAMLSAGVLAAGFAGDAHAGQAANAAEQPAQTSMPSSVKEKLAAANATVPRISAEEATALMTRGDAIIVDVRDAPELQQFGKIKGATHVPRGMLEFRADPDSPYYDKAFDRDKTVILYCASGARSALAGKTLQELGYKDVRNLGAFKDWAEDGGAVEKF